MIIWMRKISLLNLSLSTAALVCMTICTNQQTQTILNFIDT